MKRHPLLLEIAPGTEPLFKRVASTLVKEIQRGRLRRGMLLPGTRKLARQLGMHRNTVCAAYDELVCQRWAVSKKRQGTYVADRLPGDLLTHPTMPPHGMEVAVTLAAEPCQINLSDIPSGIPWFPNADLVSPFKRALSCTSKYRQVSEQTGPQALLNILSEFLGASRGLLVAPSHLLITRSAQMNLFLAAQYISRRSNTIYVEEPGSPSAWNAFRLAGLTPVGVGVDEHGLNPDLLEDDLRRSSTRAIYLTPFCQYPTTVTLAQDRRERLLRLSELYGLTILEDDYANDFCGDDGLGLPLAASDRVGRVIYISSFANLLQPGLGLGFMSAAPAIISKISEIQAALDEGGNLGVAGAIAKLMGSGELIRYARKLRKELNDRRGELATLLTEAFDKRVSFTNPPTGSAIWMKLPSGPDAEIFRIQAARLGLRLTDTLSYYLARKQNALRLSVGHLSTSDLNQAVRRLKLSEIVSRCVQSSYWEEAC